MKRRPRFNWNVVIIALIIIIGLAPRAVEVFSGNYLFGFDQGLFFEKVRRIVVDHKFTLIGEEVGGRGGFFQGPGFYYLLAVPFYIFNGNPYGAMVLMLMTGVTMLVGTALLVYRLFGKSEAIFITLLMAVSPAIVAQSRFIWNPFFIPPISVIVWCLYYLVLKRKEIALPVQFFFIGLMFHFEIATGIMTFLLFSIFTLWLWMRRLLRGRFVAISYVVFFLTQVHFLIFDLRHNFIITQGILRTVLGEAPHAITWVYVQHMFRNHLDVFRYNFLSTFWYADKLWIVLTMLVIVGIYSMYRDTRTDVAKKRFLITLLITPFMLFVLYMKYLWPMWEWWLLELGVVYIFLVGLIFSWGWSKGGISRWVTAALICLYIFAHIRSTIRFYQGDFHDYGGTHKIRGKIDVIDDIYKDAEGKPFNLLVFSPPIYTYPYDYLVWWYGNRTYGYMPGKEKQGTFYLLIEPDPSKPWSYEGWIQTVIKTGTVEKRWTTPSGFIIEKRKE